MSHVFGAAGQTGLIVRDIDSALKHWIALGVGPWFYRDRIDFRDFTYRDQACDVEVSVGLANSGAMQFELIQPRNDARSIYNDFLRSGREGIHHLGFLTRTFDADKARYDSLGMRPVMRCRVGDSPDCILFYEPSGTDGVAAEIIELSGGKGRVFERIRQAADGWSGDRPIRDFAEVMG